MRTVLALRGARASTAGSYLYICRTAVSYKGTPLAAVFSCIAVSGPLSPMSSRLLLLLHGITDMQLGNQVKLLVLASGH